MNTNSPKPSHAGRVAVQSSFVLESARLCILDLALNNFGTSDSLLFRSNTDGVEVVAAEALPGTTKRRASGDISAMVALRWRARPPMLRLVCRSEKMGAALAISNFETTSLAHAVAGMDAHRLLALAGILHSAIAEDRAPHSYVLDEVRKQGRRDFFLNWLPASEERFVCLVMQAGFQDPGGLPLFPLTNFKARMQWLLPVSHSVRDNHAIIMYDFNGIEDPYSPVEIAAAMQDKLYYWRLGSRSEIVKPPAEMDQLARLSARWTDNVCDTIAMARSYLLADRTWEGADIVSAGKFQYRGQSLLFVTDVVDMFGLTLVMAAAETWKTKYDRILLLLPSWRGKLISPAAELFALIENFGGSEIIEPITSDELTAILQTLEQGMSVSFTSAAAPYDRHIEEAGRTHLPIASFELSSPEQLLFFQRLAQYAVSAGGPLVWRELQSAYADTEREGILSSLLTDSQSPSLVDDLYAAPCSSLGWPLRAFRHFDRHMMMAFRSGELE